MVFFYFFYFIFSNFNYCEAEHKTALPIPNMTLKNIQIITRHGKRTPLEIFLPKNLRGQWICDSDEAISKRIKAAPSKQYRYFHQILDERLVEYPPNCRPGDLLVEGMEQHKLNGIAYRKYLIEDLKFLPEEMDPTYFKFYSSPIERCIRSAESFLVGFYPPKSNNEVLSIETGSTTIYPLMINPNFCKELKDQDIKLKNSTEYKNFLNLILPSLIDTLQFLNLDNSPDNIHKVCQWAIAYNCSNTFQGPSFFTNEMVSNCRKQQAYMQYGLYSFEGKRGIASAAPMRQLIFNADESIGSSNSIKFILHSAHDTTVASLVSLLGYQYEFIPPYSSHLAMELWEDNLKNIYIRWVFNGKPLIPLGFDSEIVRYDFFRFNLMPLIDHCYEI